MQNLLKNNFFYQEKKERFGFYYEKTSSFNSKIYQKRKSPDSPGGFGFERTRKID